MSKKIVWEDKIGESGISNSGDNMKIIDAQSKNGITIQFEDGTIVYKKQYRHFKSGNVRNPILGVGNEFVSGHNEKYKIIKQYVENGITKYDIEFECGTIVCGTQHSQTKKGEVKHHLTKTLFDVGYLGIGNYKPTMLYEDGIKRMTPQYNTWFNFLNRCYNKQYQENKPTYEDCSVCEEWLNFQTFSKWYDDNYYQLGEEEMFLDKDILNKGNKIYSPENCIFVTKPINSLFTKCNSARGSLPIGVNKKSGREDLYVEVSMGLKDGKRNRFYQGKFKTKEDAFNCYKTVKESYIKQVADEYKQKYPNFPQKLYDAMYSYQVEITD